MIAECNLIFLMSKNAAIKMQSKINCLNIHYSPGDYRCIYKSYLQIKKYLNKKLKMIVKKFIQKNSEHKNYEKNSSRHGWCIS